MCCALIVDWRVCCMCCRWDFVDALLSMHSYAACVFVGGIMCLPSMHWLTCMYICCMRFNRPERSFSRWNYVPSFFAWIGMYVCTRYVLCCMRFRRYERSFWRWDYVPSFRGLGLALAVCCMRYYKIFPKKLHLIVFLRKALILLDSTFVLSFCTLIGTPS